MKDLRHGDCLELMKDIPSGSIDLILADLPYGTTKCKWDIPIHLNWNIDGLEYDEWMLKAFKDGVSYKDANQYWNKNKAKGLWQHYERIIKGNGAILLFAQTPFDKVLGDSNKKLLRYEWIWEKTQATGHLNANKMPMKAHENILVFYKSLPTYNPQKTTGHKPINTYTKYIQTQNNTELYGEMKLEISGGGETDRYPRSIQTFSSDKQRSKLHPTQKPVKLLKYFIETYTNEGDVVLDNVMGSGSTGEAALELNRSFIGMEKELGSYNDACDRLSSL